MRDGVWRREELMPLRDLVLAEIRRAGYGATDAQKAVLGHLLGKLDYEIERAPSARTTVGAA